MSDNQFLDYAGLQVYDADIKEYISTHSSGGTGGTVYSVNGKTGDVVLDSDDIGALPASSEESIDIDFSNFFS